jgi:hypothetical protein
MEPEAAIKLLRASCPDDFGYAEEPEYCLGTNKDGHCDKCWGREYVSKVENVDISEKGCEDKLIYAHTEYADGNNHSIIKDSGERTTFTSGAQRDMHEGKGDMASVPWEAILRLSVHYENGAKKYERWNFRKGIPVSSFIDSACRHLAKYQCGCDDEDHLAAAAFNVLGAMLMENTKPEMVDLPLRQGKNTFEYFKE